MGRWIGAKIKERTRGPKKSWRKKTERLRKGEEIRGKIGGKRKNEKEEGGLGGEGREREEKGRKRETKPKTEKREKEKKEI